MRAITLLWEDWKNKYWKEKLKEKHVLLWLKNENKDSPQSRDLKYQIWKKKCLEKLQLHSVWRRSLHILYNYIVCDVGAFIYYTTT